MLQHSILNMKHRYIIAFSMVILLTGLAIGVNAQKVTELQEVSVKAPHAVKIDGKNFEWQDVNFSANKRTNLSYIMSNDDKNLYLVIKSADVPNNMKILAGGITFSINPDGKKKEKESIKLTYPIIQRPARGSGGNRGQFRSMGGAMGGGGQPDTKQRDSMMAAMQKTQLAQAKEIKIHGFKTTKDTLVSIYNEFGIKAFANIEKDNSFFYEIGIPLEALGIAPGSASEFAYNIKVNGLQLQGLDGGFSGGRGNFGGGGGGGGFRPGGGGGGMRSGIDFQDMMSPTDFWGKYILVKK